ncbi:MAG: NnrS family protein, partial [Deltaproteobacteria bacterium]|nr:NnrS family protein [Deltaproteobacteria bacterium]
MDPYQVLFPIGFVFALVGTIPWILFSVGFGGYPGLKHADWMVGGFLLSFAMGFLMTAVPRFTGSDTAKKVELLFGGILSLSLLFFSFIENRIYFYTCLLTCFIFLFTFAFKRFRKRLYTPPPSFVFVGIGLLLGISGVFALLISYLQSNSGLLFIFGKLIFYQGMMMSFLLGIGSRLIPAFLGWAEFPVIQLQKKLNTKKQNQFVQSKQFWFLVGIAFILSFILEAFVEIQIGRILRALIGTLIAVLFWKIHKKPNSKGYLVFWLWLASISFILGLWIYGVFPV